MNKVHHTAIIGDNVIMGDNNIIEPYVIIKSGTVIGSGNTIGSFSILGENPQVTHKVFNAKLKIGNNNTIGRYCSIDKGEAAGTIISDNNIIYAYTHIAHNCKIGKGNLIVNNCTLAGNVTIKDSIILYGYVSVYNELTIGSHSIIGANTNVTKNILPYSYISDKRVKQIISTKTDNSNIKQAFKILKEPISKEEKIAKLEEIDDKEVQSILNSYVSHASVLT